MSIASYTLKIKELADAHGLINVVINDDKMVHICLGCLAPQIGRIRSTILARENSSSFSPFNRYYRWKKTMPEKGVMHPMVRYSTPSWMRQEYSAEKIEVDSIEGDRVSRPDNTTPIIGKPT